MKELEKLIASREGELSEIQESHHKVEEEVRDLHSQIMNIGGDELKRAKADLEELGTCAGSALRMGSAKHCECSKRSWRRRSCIRGGPPGVATGRGVAIGHRITPVHAVATATGAPEAGGAAPAKGSFKAMASPQAMRSLQAMTSPRGRPST